jgi:8-oxo-dGTP pyrophosphatase MutT (NUDIX family)
MPLNIDLERLAKKLMSAEDNRSANAAVALILSAEDSDLSLLLVRRIDNLADPWSGQIGLPGGKREKRDSDLWQCVMRETLEETGVDLAQGRFVGSMLAMRSMPRPDLMIVPFVVFFEHRPVPVLNCGELESFVWLRLREVFRSRTRIKIGVRETPAFVVGEIVIWGLTFRILENLIEIVKSLNP